MWRCWSFCMTKGNLKVCGRETCWSLLPYICILCFKYPLLLWPWHLSNTSPPVSAWQDISLMLWPTWDQECDGWCTDGKVRYYCRDCTRSISAIYRSSHFLLLYHLTNLHKSNKNFLAFKPSIKLVTVKLFSKLWPTCNCFVSISVKYLAQCPNREKFLKSSLEKQLSTPITCDVFVKNLWK